MAFKVFVADDDEDFLVLFRKVAMQVFPGTEFYSANNGYKTVALLKKMFPYKPDIIFIDIMMPIMDGYELAREIKKIPMLGSVAIVLYSGGQLPMRTIDSDKVFVKPSNSEELEKMIRDSAKILKEKFNGS